MRKWLIENHYATVEELDAIEAEEKAAVFAEKQAAWEDHFGPVRDLARDVAGKCTELLADIPDGADEQKNVASQTIALLKEGIEHPPGSRHVFKHEMSLGDICRAVRSLLVDTIETGRRGSTAWRELRDILARTETEGVAKYQEHLYAPQHLSPLNVPEVLPSETSIGVDSQSHIIAAGTACRMKEHPEIVITGQDEAAGGVQQCRLGLRSGHSQMTEVEGHRSPAIVHFVPKDGFGPARVWNSRLDETSIVGEGAGLARRGFRPIICIQFADYLKYGAALIRDLIALVRWVTGGGQDAAVVIDVPAQRLEGTHHASAPFGDWMASFPGMRIAVPRNAVEYVGMQNAALQGRDPVIIASPLPDLFGRMDVPENLKDICMPFGHPAVLKEGTEVTIVTYGVCANYALEAAQEMKKCGVSAEIIDLRKRARYCFWMKIVLPVPPVSSSRK